MPIQVLLLILVAELAALGFLTWVALAEPFS
ncbi:hypothetical protein LCGC14_0816610 [marine sediment metagenome]|uniref:Uncharacterized protein n=1 Tax=marine sediment metagenome TaxID=412755 RepID=A0A0F9PPR6_9ZZZZ